VSNASAASPRPFFGPAASLIEEHDYTPRLEGTLPDGLRGTLYRNGPGIFERAGYRKRCLLDGDGMIQAFTLDGTAPRYRNRFVRTEKFVEEERAGRWLYPTWTTRRPGGFLANMNPQFKSSAGVNVVPRETGLYALEDGSFPHRMDPDTLETLGPDRFGADRAVFSAHAKVDGRDGEWIHFGTEFGRQTLLHLAVLDRHDKLLRHRKLPLVGGDYIHDFFVTENQIVCHVHPVSLRPLGLLCGLRSFVESLRWEGGRRGTTVLVFDRRDFSKEPIRLEAAACWMWHSANAFERDGEIVADFIAYDEPDHFLDTEGGALWTMMSGDGSWSAQRNPGQLRRYVIDPEAGSLSEEPLPRLAGAAEFPVVHPNYVCHPYRYVYTTTGFAEGSSVLPNGVARVDVDSGDVSEYRYPEGVSCHEAVMAPKANGTEAEGWLLSLTYDEKTEKSALAILDAQDVAAGPVATLHLEHHAPITFHGSFAPKN
jgi:all-trans-8'-apo-beta-carotenal 15,15'-oxygenase